MTALNTRNKRNKVQVRKDNIAKTNVIEKQDDS